MKSRALIAWAILLASLHGSAAQQPSGRIDLEAVALASPLVAVRVAFSKSAAACPEDRAILRVTGGSLRQHQVFPRKATANQTDSYRPVDNETYLIRIATKECRLGIAIRQQMRREGGPWTALLVPVRLRPSLPAEQREALERRFRDDALAQTQSGSSDAANRLTDAWLARRTAGSLAQGGVGLFSLGARFEDTPTPCVTMLGDYAIDQNGITFSFSTGLPGDVNRFVIERVDIDDEQSRLYFTQDNCRLELTIGQEVLHNGHWIARAIAPYVPSKPRILIQRSPDSRPPWLDRSD